MDHIANGLFGCGEVEVKAEDCVGKLPQTELLSSVEIPVVVDKFVFSCGYMGAKFCVND